MSPSERSVAQFWAKVERGDGCWLWTGARINDGYGLLRRSGRTILAHRFAFQLTNGPIPDGKVVMHACDTPACVRPDHLRLGTSSENSRDMSAKGRASTGAKMTPTLIAEARAARLRGEAVPSIAAKLGVSGRTVQKAMLSASLPARRKAGAS